jgi:hypothetical protein
MLHTKEFPQQISSADGNIAVEQIASIEMKFVKETLCEKQMCHIKMIQHLNQFSHTKTI